MHNFRRLDVWTLSMEIAVEILKLNDTLPYQKRNGLSKQIERSSVSVPSNIAEGSGRKSVKEYLHVLNIASASSYELETQILIAQQIDFYTGFEINPIIEKIHLTQKMLYGLIQFVKRKNEN